MPFFKPIFCFAFCLLSFSLTVGDTVEINRIAAERMFLEPVDVGDGPRILVLRETTPFEVRRNENAYGAPLRIGAKTFEYGIGSLAPHQLRIVLDKPADRFRATVGIDALSRKGSVRFHVCVDGKTVFSSPVLTKENPPETIDVPLNGSKEFELVLDDAGDDRTGDMAVWGDAKVVYRDGSEARIDEIGPIRGERRLPFSFRLDGKPFTELVSGWQRRLSSEEKPGEHKILHTLVFTDPKTNLELEVLVAVYTDTPAIDWTLRFTNNGKTDSPILSDLEALDTTLWSKHPSGTFALHRLKGCISLASVWNEDWVPLVDRFRFDRTIEFAPIEGRSSMGACPFFTLQSDQGGVVTAIGWTGRWKASVSRQDGPARITAGMQKLNVSLKPGESIRSPRILQCYWSGTDLDTGHNRFRQVMLAHVIPKIDGKTIVPPIGYMANSFYSRDKGTETELLDYIEKSKGLGFEYFWHEAFYAPKPFPEVGNFALPLERSFDLARYPNGFSVISRRAKEYGQKYLQWYEVERASYGSIVDKEHPDWLLEQPGNKFGSGIDLGNPEAWKYIRDFLATSIKEYGTDVIRIDANLLNYDIIWDLQDKRNGPRRVGISEIRYVEGLYALWDSLIGEFPGLYIDNCAAGGQRIDLETCSRSLPLWRTDATIGPMARGDTLSAAFYNQVISYGMNRYIPFNTSGQTGTTPYLFRSGFNGGIAFGEDYRADTYPKEELKQAIAEGKRIRKYFFGNYYPISPSSPDRESWCIMQYHRPTESDGMILVFRREHSFYDVVSHMPFREIDPQAEYEVVVSRSFVPEEPKKMSGREFLDMKIELKDRPDSMLIEYDKK